MDKLGDTDSGKWWNMTTILLVEQNAALAAQLADRIYVLVRGTVRAESDSASLALTDLLKTYLG